VLQREEHHKSIKSKTRVQKHGEVFTPLWMVEKMLDEPGINEACNSLTATFLEPGPGEGAFICEILRRKLLMVSNQYANTLVQYENFSLCVLSTLYGIELLEDNTQICSMNLFEVYKSKYYEVAKSQGKRMKPSVLDSAKTIISKNIVQGNFLTHKGPDNKPFILNEWQILTKITAKTTSIKVIRTEYSLDDIIAGRKNGAGSTWKPPKIEIQPGLFDDHEIDQLEESTAQMRYVPSIITAAYKEEMERYE